MARGSQPGERRGGRKAGTPNKSTIAQGLALSELAQQHTEVAISTLVSVARSSESDAARVSAAVAILDRGYGKPPQSTTLKAEDGALFMVPVLNVIERTHDQSGTAPKAVNGSKLNGH